MPIDDNRFAKDTESFIVHDSSLETRPEEIVVTAVSSDQALIPDSSIVTSGEGAERQIQITPAAGATGGPVTITLTVTAKGEIVRKADASAGAISQLAISSVRHDSLVTQLRDGQGNLFRRHDP